MNDYGNNRLSHPDADTHSTAADFPHLRLGNRVYIMKSSLVFIRMALDVHPRICLHFPLCVSTERVCIW
jgi:hypothetical protein